MKTGSAARHRFHEMLLKLHRKPSGQGWRSVFLQFNLKENSVKVCKNYYKYGLGRTRL